MKALLITICLLFICGCVETTEEPLVWYPSDSIEGRSWFDEASDAFDDAAEGREVRTWETTVSTAEALSR